MQGIFFEAFGAQAEEENRLIPDEVLDALNKGLPSNFSYIQDENGRYTAVPDADLKRMVLKVEFDFESEPELGELYKKIGYNKFIEYIYRAQKAVPAKELKIGDEERQVPAEDLYSEPFSDEKGQISHLMIYPSPFQEKHILVFQSIEGDKVEVEIQQVKYDSLTETKSESISFPALKIEIYQYSPLLDEDELQAHTSKDNQIQINYSVNPKDAKTVDEAIQALHIFKGLLENTTTVNGKLLSAQKGKVSVKPMQLENSLHFWKTAKKLEEYFDVSFDPSAELTNEDFKMFAELDMCVAQKKWIKWKSPFDHFHIGGIHVLSGEQDINDFVGVQNLKYAFVEGPLDVELLGVKFKLYSKTIMKDFVITSIDWNDEGDGEVYIADSDENPWILSRQYCRLEEAEEFMKEIDGKNM